MNFRKLRLSNLLAVFFSLLCCILSGESTRGAETLSQTIDRLVAAGWSRKNVQPAGLSSDAEFVRRLYLDLIGRIPTRGEAQRFCSDTQSFKRAKLIDALLASDEFNKHWRENLNLLLMGGPAFGGDAEWRGWLESALRKKQGWDVMARALLRARPGQPEEAGAAHFLVSRFAQGPSGLDLATRDVSRIFFGVDIQCARCHKHPEIDQWKQESYWGMAAFWNRSYPLPIKGKMYLAERASGEVDFSTRSKAAKTVAPRFLTGETVAEVVAVVKPPPAPAGKAKVPLAPGENPADYLVPPETAPEKTHVPVPKFSRRDKLVELAINSKSPYFKRAAVNYLWSQMLGRGLVEPVDQMHDANPASHPELLQVLADDFAAHQFDLRALLRGIANSRTYQLTSHHPVGMPRPAESTYACSAVRPLSIHQLAISMLTTTGYLDGLKNGAEAKTRIDTGVLRAKLEAQYASLLAELASRLNNGTEPFQPGVREALFQANSPQFADIVAKGGLAARLAGIADDHILAEEVFWCVLSREPSKEESERLQQYLMARRNRRLAACEQIVWALVASAEFRFNH